MSENNAGYQIRIQSVLSSMKKKNERRIYEFIEQNKKEIIHMSIDEAAEACQVSKAAIVRFAQKLGYKGYQAMKISIAQEAIEPEHQIYSSLSKQDTIPDIVGKIIESNIQALKATFDIIDSQAIEKAVNLILNSSHLIFFGIGGSGSVALDGQHKFVKIGYLALAFTDSNLQAMTSSILKKEDVVIAISHSGASKDILIALETARQAGASIIVITNYARSPIISKADVVLYTASNETAFNSDALSSRIAELTILDMLYISTAFKKYDESYANIIKTRKALDSTKI